MMQDMRTCRKLSETSNAWRNVVSPGSRHDGTVSDGSSAMVMMTGLANDVEWYLSFVAKYLLSLPLVEPVIALEVGNAPRRLVHGIAARSLRQRLGSGGVK